MPVLPTTLTPTTPQNGPSHSNVHNHLHTVYNTVFLATDPVLGTNQNPGTPTTAVQAQFIEGTVASPATSYTTATVIVSRRSNMDVIPLTAGDSNAALWVNHVNDGLTQPVAVQAYASNIDASVSDACAIYARAFSTNGSSYGVFSLISIGPTAKAKYGGFAENPVVVNASNLHWPYDGTTTVGPAGVIVQCIPDADPPGVTQGAKKSGVGVLVTTLGGDPSRALFDVGFAVWTASVVSSAFRDDSSAVASVVLNGSHTYGIDMAGGTFGNWIRFDASHLITSAAGDPAYVYDTAGGNTFFLYNRAGAGFFTWILKGALNFGTSTGYLYHDSLPAANPGAGTKRFWYNPGAGNAVFYSP